MTKELGPDNSFFEQSNFVGDAKRSFSFLTNAAISFPYVGFVLNIIIYERP